MNRINTLVFSVLLCIGFFVSLSQAETLLVEPNVPGEQAMQAVSFGLPITSLKVPGGHGFGAARPFSSQ